MKRASTRPAGALLKGVLGALLGLSSLLALAEPPGLQGLPPEPLLRSALESAPLTQAVRQQWSAEREAADAQRHSPYEWTLRAGAARRSDVLSQRLNEREISIERSLRIGAKAGIDAALADQGALAAQAGWELSWRDGVRAVLKSWFELLRQERKSISLNEQAALGAQQMDVVRRRVKAGDAPRLDLLLAQAEHERLGAEAATAALRVQAMRGDLRQRFPALGEAVPIAVPDQLDDYRPDISAELALRQRAPELALAQQQLNMAKLKLRRQQSDRLADPTIGFRVAQERSGEERVMGLSLSIPFGGPQRDARVRVASAELQAAQARLQDTELHAAADARRLLQEAVGLVQTQRQLAHTQALSAEAARLAQRAYAAGETPLFSALQSLRQASEARAAAEMALVDALELQSHIALELRELLPPAAL